MNANGYTRARTRLELKESAKSALRLHYWPAVLAAFILTLFGGGGGGTGGGATWRESYSNLSGSGGSLFNSVDPAIVLLISGAVLTIVLFGVAFSLLLGSALTVGCSGVLLRILRGDSSPLSDFGLGFKNYGRNILAFLLQGVLLLFWFLLLIVPGIIKSYSYAMMPYILAEHPSISPMESLRLSEDIMRGHRFELFVIQLSFIGWAILSAFTCGILSLFYLSPYMKLTEAAFYQDLKADAVARSVIAPDALPVG